MSAQDQSAWRIRPRRALDAHGMHFGPNMTPMVDVVMVILVFFMASTAVLGPEWFLRASVAQAGAERAGVALPEVRLRVRVEAEAVGAGASGVLIDGFGLERAPLGAFESAVRSAAPGLLSGGEPPIVEISVGDGVRYEDAARVHAACAAAGLSRIELR
ncbi:MAG: biopolymer transporter ExbD [Planctomycetota bacterium]